MECTSKGADVGILRQEYGKRWVFGKGELRIFPEYCKKFKLASQAGALGTRLKGNGQGVGAVKKQGYDGR
jgi:hypothetical protein